MSPDPLSAGGVWGQDYTGMAQECTPTPRPQRSRMHLFRALAPLCPQSLRTVSAAIPQYCRCSALCQHRSRGLSAVFPHYSRGLPAVFPPRSCSLGRIVPTILVFSARQCHVIIYLAKNNLCP